MWKVFLYGLMAQFTGNLILVQFSAAIITHYSLVSFFIIEYFHIV